MLTPQDIQNKEFTKAVFGGYDMTGVDDFLEALTEDYSALYKENAILKSKIKVLVEKVEEYRSTEDSMRMALLTAQKMGDDLLKEAEQKKSAMLEDAENLMKKKVINLKKEVDLEEYRLSAAKEKTREFVRASRQIIASQEGFLAKLDELIPQPAQEPKKEISAQDEAPAAKEEKIVETAKEIDEAVSKIVDGDGADDQEPEARKYDDEDRPTKLFKPVRKADKMTDEEDGEDALTPRPKFDFKDLKFGKNYDGEE